MRVFPDGDLNLADQLDMQQLLVQEQSDRLGALQRKQSQLPAAAGRKAMVILTREPAEEQDKR